jgi:hypothetical protein
MLVRELETGVSAHMGVPVHLEIVTLQVIYPAGIAENAIRNYFNETLPDSYIQSLIIHETDAALQVDIIVMTAQPVEQINLAQAQSQLTEQIARPVAIRMAILPIIPETHAEE